MIGKLIDSAGFLSSGGTIGGDLTISGDLTVSGSSAITTNEVIQGTTIIDGSNAEAFLVRKDSDGGDVFTVDTTNSEITTGIDGTGVDVIFYSATAGDNFTWDASEEKLTITGTSGAVALDVHTGKATFGDAGTTYATINQNALSFSNATGIVGTTTSHDLRLNTNDEIRMTINSAGNVGIGCTPEQQLSVAANSGGGHPRIGILNHVGDSEGGTLYFRKSRNTTVGSHTVVQDGDEIGVINFSGSDGDSFEAFAAIKCKVDGTPGNSDTPGRLEFYTVDNGTNTLGNPRMTIKESGNIGINCTDPTAPIHIQHSALSGFDSHADDLLVIERTGGVTSINMAVDTDQTSYLMFSDTTRNAGSIGYFHDGDLMAFRVGAATRMALDSNSRISLGNNDSSGGATCTIFGYLAGDKIASGGTDNTLIGKQAGNQTTYGITTGDYNTAVGSSTLGASAAAHITGSSNTAMGYNSMLEAQGAVANNTAVGSGSLQNVTTGSNNTVMGRAAADALTTGANNTIIGDSALGTATTATENIVMGGDAMVGVPASVALTGCVAIGQKAFVGSANTTTGANYTVAVGYEALNDLTTGAGNVAVGYTAASALTTAAKCVAIGDEALNAMQEGSGNVAVGHEALKGANHADAVNNIAIGANAMDGISTNGAAWNIGIGADALGAALTGDYNIAIGQASGGAVTSGASNTIIGANAGDAITTTSDCVLIGRNAGTAINHNNANGTTIVGRDAGEGLTSGIGNTALGYAAMNSLTTGGYSTFLGHNAGLVHTTGGYNMAIGYGAMDDTNAGNNSLGSTENTFIGVDSGGGTWADTSSSYNVGVGNYVMDDALDGASYNTAVGQNSMSALTTGDYNTALGRASAHNLTTGTQNVLLGYGAVTNAVSSQNQIVIGYEATGVANNSVTLGNASTDHVYAAQDSVDTAAGVVTGAIVHAKDIATTDGVLKENLITNSGFGVWSNGTLENVGSDLITNGGFGSNTNDWDSQNAVLSSEGSGQSGNCLKVLQNSGSSGYASQDITTVIGKLYKVSFYLKQGSGTAAFVRAGTSQYGSEVTGDIMLSETGSWAAHSYVFEATATTTYVQFAHGGTDTQYAFYDTITMYEVTPGCVAGDDKACDGWTKLTATDIWRQEHIDIGHASNTTNSHNGSYYALRMLSSGNANGDLRYTINSPEVALYKGRTVTAGAWVKTDASSQVKLNIVDDDGSNFSSLNSGTGWEWLEVTTTISASATYIALYVFGTNTKTIYISQPMLVLGNSIGSGNYTRPQGEVIYLETTTHRKLTDYDNVTISSDVATVNLEAQSEGRIPKNAKAVQLRFVGKSSTVGAFMLIDNRSVRNNLHVYSQVSNVVTSATAIVATDDNGDIGIERSDTWTNCYIYYDAVHLH